MSPAGGDGTTRANHTVRPRGDSVRLCHSARVTATSFHELRRGHQLCGSGLSARGSSLWDESCRTADRTDVDGCRCLPLTSAVPALYRGGMTLNYDVSFPWAAPGAFPVCGAPLPGASLPSARLTCSRPRRERTCPPPCAGADVRPWAPRGPRRPSRSSRTGGCAAELAFPQDMTVSTSQSSCRQGRSLRQGRIFII